MLERGRKMNGYDFALGNAVGTIARNITDRKKKMKNKIKEEAEEVCLRCGYKRYEHERLIGLAMDRIEFRKVGYPCAGFIKAQIKKEMKK